MKSVKSEAIEKMVEETDKDPEYQQLRCYTDILLHILSSEPAKEALIELGWTPPGQVGEKMTISELHAVTIGWDETNQRRGELIYTEGQRELTAEESEEFQYLQHLTDLRIALMEFNYYYWK